jgi:hypothetical protein
MVSPVHLPVMASIGVAATMRLCVPCSVPTGMTFLSSNSSMTCRQGSRPARSSVSSKSESSNQSSTVATFIFPGRTLISSKVQDFALTRLSFLNPSSSSVLGSNFRVRVCVAAFKGNYISLSASV